jgi:hypothetical protein
MSDVYVSWGRDSGKDDLRVARACNRCYGNAVSVRELDSIEVVSLEGTAHMRGKLNGQTACGIVIGTSWWQEEPEPEVDALAEQPGGL